MNAPPHIAASGAAVSPLRRATLLCLAALTIMSGATMAPSLPALQSHFAGHPDSELLSRLVLTLPALAIALCAPIAGAIADRFGRLRLLLFSICLYSLAGLSGLVADSLAAILVGRALLGVAVAGTMTSVTALVGDYFTGSERESYMSQQGAFVSFGGVVFLIGGGWLADQHWRAPFAVYGIALLVLPAAMAFLSEAPRKSGSATSSSSADSVPYLLLAALFVAALLNSVAFYLIPTQLPFFLREIGISLPSDTGLAIAGSNLVGALSSLYLYRHLRTRFKSLEIFAFGFAFMAAGLLLISRADSFTAVMFATGIYGIGMGAMMPHLFSTAIHLAPERMRGRIAGGLSASIFFGQFLSPLLSQPWSQHFGLPTVFLHMGILLLALSAAAAVGAKIRIRLPASYGRIYAT
ncbi:MFS transporter [Microbulbifer taiwanensis]|uniref:MFS transporter n=1 Tax=Microbulbifer taiwanensis TaxID=986746 RepID=A0ABW1YMU5_9GAMM|nr:MFS transporter [Microbulbifer taiwanensis]